MAIIQDCCGWPLRNGCYASATFSLIYFFLFTWITGYMTVGRILPMFSNPEVQYESNIHHGRYDNEAVQTSNDLQIENDSIVTHDEQQQREHVMGKISSVTSVPTLSTASYVTAATAGNESGSLENNVTRRVLASHSNSNSHVDDTHFEIDRENNSVTMLRLFLFSDTYAMVQTVNLVLDLLCEVAGVYSSILLIRGLQQERKSWFWPWMIVVPTHIVIDAISMGSIMMEYLLEPMGTTLQLLLLTVSVDVTLNSINAYGLICVISQYQEYKAGRGTAAYVEFTSQTPTILLETASSAKTVLNKPITIPSQTRRKSTKDYSSSRVYNNDKSDTYCEEFSLQTLTHTNEKQGLTDNHIVRATKNGSVHHETVKNGQPSIIALDGETQATTPSTNNNGNNEKNRRASTPAVASGNKGGATPKGKFGKFLDVSQKRRASNLPDLDFDGCSTDVDNGDKIKPVSNNHKCISWKREQSEGTKSDSDSEDHTVDVLSAFGILGSSKK